MTSTAPTRPLAEVLDALEASGLRRGVGPVAGHSVPPSLTTGLPGLDAALRCGGWPRGALAALEGPLGCGATSLALTSLAACQGAGGLVAWIDTDGSFDPATAARQGVDLEWLLIVRPRHASEAIELAAWLTRSRLVDLIALDFQPMRDQRRVPRGLDRLARLLSRSETVILLLGERSVGDTAAVRVSLERRAWMAVGNDLVGVRVEASVTRHRWALAGGRAQLDLWFDEGRRIAPLLPVLAEPRALHHPDARRELRMLSA